jgi:atlastin
VVLIVCPFVFSINCHILIGMWMWSEPFIREPKAAGGQRIAVLLMDTQGMFDNETTMTLTAQIFGLSTLISSFQVCRY